MIPYLLVFMGFAICAIRETTVPAYQGGPRQLESSSGGWHVAAAALVLLIGFRYQVGGDWNNYLGMFKTAEGEDLSYLVTVFDPGYIFLNWLSSGMGTGVTGVNVFCAIFFTAGIVFFCRRLPSPWLAIAVCFPYLIIVVAMGYTRQGVALGFEMLGLFALGRGSLVWFIFWMIIGATFHKSAVVLLPLAALLPNRYRVLTIGLTIVATGLAFRVLLQSDSDSLIENYVNAEYQSHGAVIRCSMNALPAALFLYFRKRFQLSQIERKVATLFSLISIALFVLALAATATTVIDRMALYLLPLQAIIFSHVPFVFADRISRTGSACAIVAYYAVVMMVWLNFADNAASWVPYRSSLLDF